MTNKALQKECAQLILPLKSNLLQGLCDAVCIFIITNLFSSLLFVIKGLSINRKRPIRNSYLQKPWKLRWKLNLTLKASDIKIGPIPLLKNSETKHMLITGSTGTGKTTCLKHLMQQIKRRGDRAVVIDTTNDLLQKFKFPNDLILNPHDEASQQWTPWAECSKDCHFDQLVKSIIPNSHAYDDFFNEAARAVILATLQKHASQKQTSSFLDTLLTKDLKDLYVFLSNTDAARYVDPQGERTSVSILSTISNALRHFRLLQDTTSPFSIRDWILSDYQKGQWLFLSSSTEQRESLSVLLSVWFSTAMHALKSRESSQSSEKIWFIIDELPSIQKLEALEPALSEFRKYGGCIVIAIQNIHQLDRIYGSNCTKSILDQCATKICFRQGDAEIAKRMSSYFGHVEFKETQEGLSYGAHQMRDGVNISNMERQKPIISPTQILELADLKGFIKLPGNQASRLTIK